MLGNVDQAAAVYSREEGHPPLAQRVDEGEVAAGLFQRDVVAAGGGGAHGFSPCCCLIKAVVGPSRGPLSPPGWKACWPRSRLP